jgi:hypothetical protein
VIEALGQSFEKKINLEHVLPKKSLDVLTVFLATQENIPTVVWDNTKLAGSFGAMYSFPPASQRYGFGLLKTTDNPPARIAKKT